MKKFPNGAVLGFLVKDLLVCLARKEREIGAGLWNGYGGGIRPGETREEAMIRELNEEAGVKADPALMRYAGVVSFRNTEEDGSLWTADVHVYLISSWTGTPRPSAEMSRPKWFLKNELPIGEMLAADRFWLPQVLAGRRIRAKATYGPGLSNLIGEVEIEDLQ